MFGQLLGWTMAWPLRAAVAALLIAAVVSTGRSRQRVSIPVVLPLGLWIALVLAGWPREEALVRCHDYLA